MPPLFRSRLFLGSVIALALVLCYLPAMRAGFVWDDDLLVTENPLVRGTDSLPYIWASAASTDYTPLTITAFWLEWRLWADNAVGYHFVNILLFALAALLLWRVLERLDVPGAWLGALLFAVHPVNVASVAWVAELKNALSLPFYLAAILCYLRFLETRKISLWILALLAAACAFLSKGSTVVLPLALLLCIWWKQRRIRGGDLLWLLPVFLLAAAAAAVTIHFQSRVIDTGNLPVPLGVRIARAGQAIWFYLGKDIAPAGLCAVYPKWPLDHQFLPLILAVALASALWIGKGCCTRGPFFAWVYFIVALLPVLGLLNMTFLDQAYVADWWQQLALPAVTALAGAGFAAAWRRARGANPALLAISAALIVIALGVTTFANAANYESMEKLCLATLARNPNAWTARDNLGNVYNAGGRLDAAVDEYQAALKLKPSDASTHSNLGTVYARLNWLDDAIAEYHAAIAIEPGNAKYWFNLGNALRGQKRDAEAVDAYSHAIDDNARWTSPRYQMGAALLDLGRAAEAGRQAEEIVHLDPTAISGHYLMARAAAAIGRFNVAAAEAATALEIARSAGDERTIQRMQETLDACKAGRQPTVPEL